MFKKLALILGCLAMVPLSVSAQFIKPLEMGDMRNAQVVGDLVTVITALPTSKTPAQDTSICTIRGGNGSSKPLGQYLVQPNSEFKSEYKNVPARKMAEFAYDLHVFVQARNHDLTEAQKINGLVFVPYEKQREFADGWWRRNHQQYKDMPFFFHDGFLNDALLDGTNVYNWYRRKDLRSANYIAWEDAALQELIKRK
ncbi:MAG: hypothetical protein WCT03_07135 [Candidatus Obscuribacterales bacterium]|jgi:hypothetical protein